MQAWLNQALQGIDPDAPGATMQIFLRLLASMPWMALFWWNVGFVVVGALLGWWKGRTAEGVVLALVLGPIGWIVVLWCRRRAQPPPLPPSRR